MLARRYSWVYVGLRLCVVSIGLLESWSVRYARGSDWHIGRLISTSSSAIAERSRCRVCYLRTKVEDWNWETIITDNIGLYSTTETYFASKAIEFGKKTQNKGYYAVQGHSRSSWVGTNRKPVCDFLLVINSNRHSYSYRCGVIAAYCSNFEHFAFLSHPQKTRINDLSYGIKMWTDFSFVLSQCTRLTDGRTEFSSWDRICIPCSTVKIKHVHTVCQSPTWNV